MLKDDQVLLISGAASQFGTAVAELASREGARLALVDAAVEAGRVLADRVDGLFIPCEPGEAGAKAAVSAAIARFGRIDALVLCGGTFQAGLLHEFTDDAIPMLLNWGLLDTIRMTRAVLPAMMESRSGSIVAVTSIYAEAAVPGVSLFAAAMGGIESFIRGVALDYCKYGIRANCVRPGRIVGPEGVPIRCIPADETRTQPIPHAGTVEDVARAVLFLCGPMSNFITAESLPVDGGALCIAHNQVWATEV